MLNLNDLLEVFSELAILSKKADPYFFEKYLILRGTPEEIQHYQSQYDRSKL